MASCSFRLKQRPKTEQQSAKTKAKQTQCCEKFPYLAHMHVSQQTLILEKDEQSE